MVKLLMIMQHITLVDPMARDRSLAMARGRCRLR
jgi:hypothetical protein